MFSHLPPLCTECSHLYLLSPTNSNMYELMAFVILPDPCVSRCNFGALGESEWTACSWIHSLLYPNFVSNPLNLHSFRSALTAEFYCKPMVLNYYIGQITMITWKSDM